MKLVGKFEEPPDSMDDLRSIQIEGLSVENQIASLFPQMKGNIEESEMFKEMRRQLTALVDNLRRMSEEK
jgi:hypothetical protein